MGSHSGGPRAVSTEVEEEAGSAARASATGSEASPSKNFAIAIWSLSQLKPPNTPLSLLRRHT